MHLKASHLATTKSLQCLTPHRDRAPFWNHALTWHFLPVELHLDRVGGGRAWHEGGQEAVSPEGLHVARHMVAVHHDLQVARAGLRPVNCARSNDEVNRILTFEFNGMADSSVGHVTDTNLGCIESVAAERASRQGMTLNLYVNNMFANFRSDKLHSKLPGAEDVHADRKLSAGWCCQQRPHPKVVPLKVWSADSERGRPLHRNELEGLSRYLHLSHVAHPRSRHLPRFGRLPRHSFDGSALILSCRRHELFDDAALLLLHLLKMSVLNTLPTIHPVEGRRSMSHDRWSHLPRLRTLPRRQLLWRRGIPGRSHRERLHFRPPLLMNVNPPHLFAAFGSAIFGFPATAGWRRCWNGRRRFSRSRRWGCPRRLPRRRPVWRDDSRRRSNDLADCVHLCPLCPCDCDWNGLLALSRRLSPRRLLQLELGAGCAAGVGV
ncbi:unnamed protein product [Ixodes hexagonus]